MIKKLLPLLLVACDAAPQTTVDGARCDLVVVASDYLSTAISLLHADGTPCELDVLTSGSKRPGLLTALSGDVVLPSNPSRGVHLLDRYPNGVLTEVALSPVAVTAQARLSPGFAGNPQDLLEHGDHLVISRLESDPDGTTGSDLVVYDRALSLVRRIDLSPFADAGLDPMPTRIAPTGDLLWVGLTHMSRGDFATTGPGRVLALDLDLEVVARVDLPELTNCGQLAPSPSGDAVWIVCAGHFRADLEQRKARGGLVRIPVPTDRPIALTPDLTLPAQTLGPLGFPLAPISHDTVAIVLLGDIVTKAPDRLALVHADGRVDELATTTPFSLSGLLYLADSQLLLAADGDPVTPRLLRFDLSTTPPTPLPPVVVSKTGLPPRHLGQILPNVR